MCHTLLRASCVSTASPHRRTCPHQLVHEPANRMTIRALNVVISGALLRPREVEIKTQEDMLRARSNGEHPPSCNPHSPSPNPWSSPHQVGFPLSNLYTVARREPILQELVEGYRVVFGVDLYSTTAAGADVAAASGTSSWIARHVAALTSLLGSTKHRVTETNHCARKLGHWRT